MSIFKRTNSTEWQECCLCGLSIYDTYNRAWLSMYRHKAEKHPTEEHVFRTVRERGAAMHTFPRAEVLDVHRVPGARDIWTVTIRAHADHDGIQVIIDRPDRKDNSE